jgi:glucokinase
MRETNVRELLRLLRQHSPCSRADLVRHSGLTAPTVSAAIEQLETQGLVSQMGPGTSNGGRRPGLIEFHARHGYVVGADIGGSGVRLALADLNGTVIGRSTTMFRPDRTPNAVTSIVADGIAQLSALHRVPAKRILELAAGAPGITDVDAGRVVSAPNLTRWDDVPLRDLLQKKTGIATTIENDVNLGALGESWLGAARNTANFVFLAIGSGVGAGIVLNGVLHHGASWSAGEIGYLLLPGLPDAPPAASELGGFESAIAGANIERAWLKSTGMALRATEIFDRAAIGDAAAREVLRRTAGYLALAITNLSLVLDLSLVVLGGGVGSHRGLMEATRQILERNQFALPQLVVSSLDSAAQLHGAIWLALQAAETHGFRRRPVARAEEPVTHGANAL